MQNAYTLVHILVQENVRSAGVIWLVFLIEHLYLIGVWLGEDQRKSSIHTLEIGLHLQIFYTTPLAITNTIGRTFVFE